MNRRDEPPDDRRARSVHHTHELGLRTIFTVIAIAAGLWVLLQVWQIILLLVIALVLAGALIPLVSWLERRRVGRSLALGVIVVSLILLVAGFGALVIPTLVEQGRALVASAPAIQGRLADDLTDVPALVDVARAVREARPAQLLEPFGANALAFAGTAAQVVTLGVTTVVIAFYLVTDHERVIGLAFALLPRRFHVRTARILVDMEVVVGGYVRGQALTSLLIGVVVFVVLWLVGTPNPLALAVFAAFADLIPFVGGSLVVIPAVLATLVRGIVPALVVLAVILTYLQLEGQVVVPRVYGKTLRLSPLAVLIALLVGGQLLGIVGALLALPLAAGIRVLVEDLRIDLPGEAGQRRPDAPAEAIYAAKTAGMSARDAAGIAIALAKGSPREEQDDAARVAAPVEERREPPPAPPPAATPAY